MENSQGHRSVTELGVGWSPHGSDVVQDVDQEVEQNQVVTVDWEQQQNQTKQKP